MAEVRLDNVTKVYKGDVVGCRDINLHIRDKEFCVLVGPSGCVKSTTLRMIAGLEEITAGKLLIDGKVVNDIPPKDRNIAMVFQNYALYPHMKVSDNLAFGLKLRKFPKDEIKVRVCEAGQILGIGDLLDRKPKQLSGGQRQRVALGRAIVRKPQVFLFDEPLSNLDAKLRVQMRLEIKKLHSKLQTTMIYVTHDQTEAMTMGDRIVVMKDGFIHQVDDPIKLYSEPKNSFVAGFIGSPSMNFLDSTVDSKNGVFALQGDGFNISLKKPAFGFLSDYIGKKLKMGIRPEDIIDRLYSKISETENTVKATAVTEEPMGSENFIHTTVGENKLVMKTKGSNRVSMGDQMELIFKPDKLQFFNEKTGERIT